MAVKGRKRAAGTRFPSGDLDYASRNSVRETTSPTAIRRLKEAALASAHSQEWGTPLGRLYLEEKITSHEYSAGKKWDEVYRSYQGAMDLLSRQPKSLAIGEAAAGAQPDPESEAGRGIAKRSQAAIVRFEAAHRALCSVGMVAERATRNLCEGAGVPPYDYTALLAVRNGLAALVKYFSGSMKRA